jgi:hypothetical protein
MDMLVGNTLFKSSYESGNNKSTIDYLLVRKEDRSMLRNVKGIWEKQCVSQHCLVVGTFAEKLAELAEKVSSATGVNAKWKEI